MLLNGTTVELMINGSDCFTPKIQNDTGECKYSSGRPVGKGNGKWIQKKWSIDSAVVVAGLGASLASSPGGKSYSLPLPSLT